MSGNVRCNEEEKSRREEGESGGGCMGLGYTEAD